MEQLIATLEAHQRNEELSEDPGGGPQLDRRYSVGRDCLTKAPEAVRPDRTYHYVHPKEDLQRAMQAVLSRTDHKLPPPMSAFQGIVGREPYPVAEKAAELIQRLLHLGVARFRALFRGSRSRSEVVATFLAVLELCKDRRLRLAGTAEDCTVTCTGPGRRQDLKQQNGQRTGSRERGRVLELEELEAALEGVLFAAGEPVGVERLCLGLETDRPTLDAAAQRLMDRYRYERRGIRLLRLDASYQLCSAPEQADCILQDAGGAQARPAVPARLGGAGHHRLLPAGDPGLCGPGPGVDSALYGGAAAGAGADRGERPPGGAWPAHPLPHHPGISCAPSGLSSLEELPEPPAASREGEQMALELEARVARLKAEEAGPEGPEPAGEREP